MNRFSLPAAVICMGIFGAAACGETVYPRAAESEARKKMWEGIGTWRPGGETRPIMSVAGEVVETPGVSVVLSGIEYRIETVEDLSRGIAQVWPGIDHRWIALRVAVSYVDADTIGEFTDTKSVTLGEAIIMRDNEGGSHYPSEVHMRLIPDIHEPLVLPREGLTVPIVFALKRDLVPAGAEIGDSLQTTRFVWRRPPPPSSWKEINKKIALSGRMKELWDLTLTRVRLDRAPNAGKFLSELTFRNIYSETIPAPEPMGARLYLGSGRTLFAEPYLRTDTTPGKSEDGIGPNQRFTLPVSFTNVPQYESLELVIPYEGALMRIEAMPGFYSEVLSPIRQGVASGGLTVSIYDFFDTGGLFSIRLGALNQGSEDLDGTGMKVVGLIESPIRAGTSAEEIPGAIDELPKILYPSFEERRRVNFPRPIDGIRVEIPARDAITIWF